MSNTLSVALLGLGRFNASVGLALRRYMENDGKYRFEITGYDPTPGSTKAAQKAGAIDRAERQIFDAVAGKDIVVMALSYEDVETVYEQIAGDLRDGVVILDASPLKSPSLKWAQAHLSEEHHLVGITPILNPRYLFDPVASVDNARADLFDKGSILLSPSVSCIKAAVDLAFNFAVILGSKPRFLDPAEHDAMLAFTDTVPSVVGVAMFYSLMNNDTWDDIQWFTNPAFGALTRPLYDTHPDALRDAWLANREVLTRALDETIHTLQQMRDIIHQGDTDTIEAALVSASEEYEKWINRRYRADWDDKDDPQFDAANTLMGSILGSSLARRLTGKKDEEEEDR